MKRLFPILVGVVVAVVCVRLGLWQLDRLAERREANVTLAAQLADTVSIHGAFQFARDSVVPNRAYHGVPGVWILTPLVQGDMGVWVNRGFVPSPDARAVDLAAYREADSTTVVGVMLDGVLRRLALPADAPERLVAVTPPALDDGPHLSYAIQWFLFATIFLVGGVVLAVRGTA
ncbi:MAG: SURF1 family protein [Gemmatimonadales bacterium]